MDTRIDQCGSKYDGHYTLHSGAQLIQGNTTNVQQTANQCLADLRVTNPRHDKQHSQNTNGGLLQDSYSWILDKSEFRHWRDNEDQRLLWVKGDPG